MKRWKHEWRPRNEACLDYQHCKNVWWTGLVNHCLQTLEGHSWCAGWPLLCTVWYCSHSHTLYLSTQFKKKEGERERGGTPVRSVVSSGPTLCCPVFKVFFTTVCRALVFGLIFKALLGLILRVKCTQFCYTCCQFQFHFNPAYSMTILLMIVARTSSGWSFRKLHSLEYTGAQKLCRHFLSLIFT